MPSSLGRVDGLMLRMGALLAPVVPRLVMPSGHSAHPI